MLPMFVVVNLSSLYRICEVPKNLVITTQRYDSAKIHVLRDLSRYINLVVVVVVVVVIQVRQPAQLFLPDGGFGTRRRLRHVLWMIVRTLKSVQSTFYFIERATMHRVFLNFQGAACKLSYLITYLILCLMLRCA